MGIGARGRQLYPVAILLVGATLLAACGSANTQPTRSTSTTSSAASASSAASHATSPITHARSQANAGPSDAPGQVIHRPTTPPHVRFHAGPAIPDTLSGTVLILDSTVTGGTSSLEAQAAQQLGLTVEDDDDTAWQAKTTSQFASYAAVILGDPTCQSSPEPYLTAAENSTSVWGPAITGNVVVIGTDPVYHAPEQPGAVQLIADSIAFAASEPGHTGAYIDLSCYYADASPGTPVPVLDAVSPAGSFTTEGQGPGCPNPTHIVAQSPAISGLTDGTLGNWSCSTHDAFDNWPSSYTPLVINTDLPSSFSGPDGITGAPYIFVNSASGPSALGGPSGSEINGNGNNSELRCTCYYVQPVDSLTGDFTHSFDDLKIPGRGLSLDFSHTYSAAAATLNGPLGWGWTDSYAWSLVLDGSGNATITQENGSTVTFAPGGATGYTPPSRVHATLVHNADSTFTFMRQQDQTSYVFNATGQLIKEIDRNGYTTTLSYDATTHQLTTVTDPAGRTLSLTYDGNGHITSVTDPATRTVTFTYDSNGNLASATDPAGGVTHFTYDANHLLLTMTDPRGAVTTNVYDSSDRVVSQKDGLGRVTTFSYNPGSAGAETTTITDPNGNVTVDTYKDNLLVSETQGFGTTQAATWSYLYDLVSLGINQITDPNGYVTMQTWDFNGNLLTKTDPLGFVTTYTYDALNDLTFSTNPDDVTTSYIYDTSGNLLSVSTPDYNTGQTPTTTYTYSDSAHPGDLTAITDPDGQTTTYTYDAQGDRVSTTNPLGQSSTAAFNVLGEQTATTDPLGKTTTFAYDALGGVTATTDGLGNTTTTQYDPDRNVVAVTDPDGHVTTTTYDLDNEPTKVTRPDGSSLTYAYNAAGDQTSQIDGLGHTTAYTYDALNRLTSITDPLGRTTSYTYDLAGNRTGVTDPSGHATTYGYDAANQLTNVYYSDGLTPNVSYTYDAEGRRTSMSDGTGVSYYSYDSLGRLISSSNGAGQSVSYAYDLAGQLIGLTYPNGLNVTRGYDASGRLVSVTDGLGHTSHFRYDADGQLVGIGFANATTQGFAYDAAGRLTSLALSPSSTPGQSHPPVPYLHLTYSYDAAGLLTSLAPVGSSKGTNPGQTAESYSYTTLNQIASDSGTSYAYDAADEPTQEGAASLSYDAAAELTHLTSGAGSVSYTYDARGNRTQTTPSSGPSGTYSYDQANHLVSDTMGGTSATYAYDGDGLRMQKTVTTTSGATSTSYAWDVSGLESPDSLPQLLMAGTASFIYGPLGLVLEQITPSLAGRGATGSATVRYLAHDALGSTRALTDAAGHLVATYTYDAYGNVTTHTPSGGVVASGGTYQPFLFAGQYRDAESGLYDLLARFYDPATGQFLTRDPLVPLTKQAYIYASDDPLNLVDLTGMFFLTSWFHAHAADISQWAQRVGAVATLAGSACDVGALAFGGTNPVLDGCVIITAAVGEGATLAQTAADESSNADGATMAEDLLNLGLGVVPFLDVAKVLEGAGKLTTTLHVVETIKEALDSADALGKLSDWLDATPAGSAATGGLIRCIHW